MESSSTLNYVKMLNKIHNEKVVKDALGNEIKLQDNIDLEEGILLERLIKENIIYSSIEIGCAYGISSLHICGALIEHSGHHTIIDPYQATDWNSIGITQLTNAGLKNFTLIEEGSELALPKLLELGQRFDFAFIDGWHTFDHTLLDMFYINRLLKVGGIMVIDDVGMKGVERAVNYFLKYPAYEFVDGIKINYSPGREKFNKYVINPLKNVSKIFPQKIREEVFSSKVAGSSFSGYSMVALKKRSEDERPWNWYINF